MSKNQLDKLEELEEVLILTVSKVKGLEEGKNQLSSELKQELRSIKESLKEIKEGND